MTYDLVVLVPCRAIEQAMDGLLGRHRAIGIREIKPQRRRIRLHTGHDGGVYKNARTLLRPFVGDAEYALIVLDHAWEGAPSDDAYVIADTIEQNCALDWGARARCVCISPEIEAWVWTDSSRVSKALGWPADFTTLRRWLRDQNLWPADAAKPPDPKRAFEAATRKKRLPPSSSIFKRLAQTVSWRRCNDPSFQRLLAILRDWFEARDGDREVGRVIG